MKPEDVIKLGKDDSLNQLFKDGAELVILDNGDSAYLSIGSARYYFSGKPQEDTYIGFDNKEHSRLKLPYDGWEKSLTGINH